VPMVSGCLCLALPCNALPCKEALPIHHPHHCHTHAPHPTLRDSIMLRDTASCSELSGTVVPRSSETEVLATAAGAAAQFGRGGVGACLRARVRVVGAIWQA
jgi:hypothetical protein